MNNPMPQWKAGVAEPRAESTGNAIREFFEAASAGKDKALSRAKNLTSVAEHGMVVGGVSALASAGIALMAQFYPHTAQDMLEVGVFGTIALQGALAAYSMRGHYKNQVDVISQEHEQLAAAVGLLDRGAPEGQVHLALGPDMREKLVQRRQDILEKNAPPPARLGNPLL